MIDSSPVFERDDLDDPLVIVLVGLPGSGKTWFTEALIASQPTISERPWTRLSQDLVKNRKAFQSLSTRAASTIGVSCRVVVDKVNATVKERKELLDRLLNPTRVMAIYFEVAPNECIRRIKTRGPHPTLPPDKAEVAVGSFRNTIKRPSEEEGFTKIFTVRTFRESERLLKLFQ